MISPLGATLHCIAALGLALALFAPMMLRQERQGPYRYLGIFLCALSANAFGTALLTDARTLASAELAQRIQVAGQGLGLLFCVDFQQRATDDETRTLRRWVRALCLVLLALAASGLMLVPGRPKPNALVTLPAARGYPEVALSGLGYAAYAAAGLLLARSVYRVLRIAPSYATTPVRLSLPPMLGALAHDLLMIFRVIESTYLLGLASAVFMLAASVGRTRRYVREGRVLRDRSEELEQSYRQLKATCDALVQKRRLAAIGELSAVIAHEVRNPLAVIKNAAASLRRRASLPEATRKRLLEIADEETSRLTRLVEDMLTYAKPLRPALGSQSTGTLIEAAVARARAEPGIPEDVSICMADNAAESVVLVADGQLVSLALSNLLSNALRASATGGQVTLSVEVIEATKRQGMAVRFRVLDRGAGMDDATRNKARDPFFTTRPKGMGLGLAIAEQIAQAHHGQLALDSRPGSGTTASLTLPLAGAASHLDCLAVPAFAPQQPPASDAPLSE